MKLRNKKIGKIRDFEFVAITKDMDAEIAKYVHNAPVLICRSIDQLNEEWEDYEPKEPLIKDEKIRKAIRAWYNILPRLVDKRILHENGVLWFGVYKFDCGQYDILNVWLRGDESYTIDELCGEEEE